MTYRIFLLLLFVTAELPVWMLSSYLHLNPKDKVDFE